MTLLERAYLPDSSATLGRWTVGGFQCFTLERPWLSNMTRKSCIPEGVYGLQLRRSPIVMRTTGGRFEEGYEVMDVVGRTHIMVHPGNWPRDTEGCILVGDSFGWTEQGPMVRNSQVTFQRLMEIMAQANDWMIDIRTLTAGYPG